MVRIQPHAISLDALVSSHPDGADRSELAHRIKSNFMGENGVGFARYLSRISKLPCTYMVRDTNPSSWRDYGYKIVHAAIDFMRIGWDFKEGIIYADVSGLWNDHHKPVMPHGPSIQGTSGMSDEDLHEFVVEPVWDEGKCPSYGFLAGALPWLTGLSGLPSRVCTVTEAIARLEAIVSDQPCQDEGWIATYIEREVKERTERFNRERESLRAGIPL